MPGSHSFCAFLFVTSSSGFLTFSACPRPCPSTPHRCHVKEREQEDGWMLLDHSSVVSPSLSSSSPSVEHYPAHLQEDDGQQRRPQIKGFASESSQEQPLLSSCQATAPDQRHITGIRSTTPTRTTFSSNAVSPPAGQVAAWRGREAKYDEARREVWRDRSPDGCLSSEETDTFAEKKRRKLYGTDGEDREISCMVHGTEDLGGGDRETSLREEKQTIEVRGGVLERGDKKCLLSGVEPVRFAAVPPPQHRVEMLSGRDGGSRRLVEHEPLSSFFSFQGDTGCSHQFSQESSSSTSLFASSSLLSFSRYSSSPFSLAQCKAAAAVEVGPSESALFRRGGYSLHRNEDQMQMFARQVRAGVVRPSPSKSCSSDMVGGEGESIPRGGEGEDDEGEASGREEIKRRRRCEKEEIKSLIHQGEEDEEDFLFKSPQDSDLVWPPSLCDPCHRGGGGCLDPGVIDCCSSSSPPPLSLRSPRPSLSIGEEEQAHLLPQKQVQEHAADIPFKEDEQQQQQRKRETLSFSVEEGLTEREEVLQDTRALSKMVYVHPPPHPPSPFCTSPFTTMITTYQSTLKPPHHTGLHIGQKTQPSTSSIYPRFSKATPTKGSPPNTRMGGMFAPTSPGSSPSRVPPAPAAPSHLPLPRRSYFMRPPDTNSSNLLYFARNTFKVPHPSQVYNTSRAERSTPGATTRIARQRTRETAEEGAEGRGDSSCKEPVSVPLQQDSSS